MSSTGRILWTAPDEEDAVTFEERTFPTEKEGIEQLVLDLDTPSDGQWRQFYHSLEMEMDIDEELAESPRVPSGAVEASSASIGSKLLGAPGALMEAGTREVMDGGVVTNSDPE